MIYFAHVLLCEKRYIIFGKKIRNFTKSNEI